MAFGSRLEPHNRTILENAALQRLEFSERPQRVDLRHSPRLIDAERIEADRGDRGCKADNLSADHIDAREIDATIVADRRRSGELDEDIRVVRSIAPVSLPAAAGDRRPSPAARRSG